MGGCVLGAQPDLCRLAEPDWGHTPRTVRWSSSLERGRGLERGTTGRRNLLHGGNGNAGEFGRQIQPRSAGRIPAQLP
jgi:hypothetical protein